MDTDTLDDEAAAVANAEAHMDALGLPTEEHVYDDYFGFEEELRVPLPDGKQYILHTVLSEGKKKQYQNSTNRDVTIKKATGDAQMRMAQGDERHNLLKAAITGWHIVRRDKNTKAWIEVPFTPRNLSDFLEKASPTIISLIEKEIRKANPWLMADLTLEDIDKEIAELQELREKKVQEEAGKAT